MGRAPSQPDSSELLEGLFQRTADGVLLTRPDGTVLRANPAACRLLGRSEDDIRRLGRQGLVVEEPGLLERIAERQERGVTSGTIALRRGDGTVFVADFTSSILPNEGGAPCSCVIFRDASAGWEAARAMRASEAMLRSVVEGTADAFFLHDLGGRFRDVNRRACESLEYTREELLRMGVTDVEPGLDLDGARAIWARVEVGVPFTLHGQHRRKDGSTFPAEVRFARMDHPGERLFTVMVRDMTDQLEREARLRASERALRLLVGTNEAILRAREEQELFREICRVAVEQGGLRMAWAGLPAEGPERAIRPVAWHGHDDGFLEAARFTWADVERGRGAAGTAMRTGEVAVANDLATDPRFAPWREAALARGYASNAALPLVHGEERLGVIGAFAAERDAFTPEVIAVLQRLADDLAFGLTVLRQRAESERAATELALAGRLFGLEVSRLDLATGLVSMSPQARRQRGLPADGPDVPLAQLVASLDPPDRSGVEAYLELARNSTPESPPPSPVVTRRLRRAGGEARWVETCSAVQYDPQGRPGSVVWASVDVTERVAEQEQLRALTARVQRVREEEKARIARDLHDDLGQVLTALQLELRGAEALVEALAADDRTGRILDRLVAASTLAG
ncbi:MAG: PAS domain S-box protein, partial [Anaeromyxobacteraceae bacterium]|nr:PAS domain S-box protein [Anaeromyxobacteraceae bacterium]